MRRKRDIKRVKRLANRKRKSNVRMFKRALDLLLIGGIIAILGVFSIYGKTFIDIKILAIVFLVFGVLSIVATKNFILEYGEGVGRYLNIIWMFIAFGGIFTFLFLFINCSSDDLDFQEQTFEIKERGKYSVKVEHEELVKKIEFEDTSTKAFESADNIRLKIKKGRLNYDVILEKTVIIKEYRNDMALIKNTLFDNQANDY